MFIGYTYFFCAGFVGWFLSALLLLKIIVSVKRCYVGVLGSIEKCINFASVLFKVVKILKGHAGKKDSRFLQDTLLILHFQATMYIRHHSVQDS